LPFFAQNQLPWQRPLTYQKRGPDRSSTSKKVSFDVKVAKISPADLEIICDQKITKKEKKERNLQRVKNLTLLASLPSGLKKRRN